MKSIENYAFSNCAFLASVVIGDGVTSIGDYAFSCRTSIASIDIPDGVINIGDNAFEWCTSLASVVIENGVTSIGDDAFNTCFSLTAINLPKSVTNIGRSAFRDCFSLTSIDIPASVTSIGNYAFRSCFSLTSIDIPAGVTSIGYGAFYECSSLISITVSSDNLVYDSREGCNAIIETSTNTLLTGCKNTTIPASVTSIGESAFYGCSSLTSIIIPDGVTRIEDYAFEECSSLTSVICRAESVPSADADAFYNVPLSKATLYVPASALDAYKQALRWKNFGTILPIEGNEDVIDGIDSPVVEQGKEADAVYYTLDGKPTTTPVRGRIYIRGGKKVLY